MKAKNYTPKASKVRAMQYMSRHNARDIVDFVLEHAETVTYKVSPYDVLYLTIKDYGEMAILQSDYLVYDGERFTYQNAGFFEAKYQED